MMLGRTFLFLGTGVLALAAGCAYLPSFGPSAAKPAPEPLQRAAKPAGTAAGQAAVGRLDLAAGRLDAAIVRFQQALQLDPNLIEAHNGLGVALGQKGRYDEAADAFRDALVLSPDSPYLLNNLGYAQLRAGQLDAAAVSLDRAHSLGRHNQHTAENLALLAQARQKAGGGAAGAVASADSGAAPAGTKEGAGGSTGSRLVHVSPGVYRLIDSAPVRLAAPAAPAMPAQAAAPAAPVKSAQAAAPAAPVKPAQAAAPAASAASVAPAQAAAPIEPPAAPPARQAQGVRPVGQPGASAGPGKAPAGAPAPDKVSKAAPLGGFEVSNGVGQRNLAGRTARALERMGIHVTRVSDYRLFGRQRTEIHYREGYRQVAKAMGETLPVKARVTASKRLPQDINVRLVVGRDWSAAQVAMLGEPGAGQEPAQAAQPASASITPVPGGVGRASAPQQLVSSAASGWRYF
ncbi:MAG: tetratricopeptide repeat protein [Burkholderiaceae bacterium]|nr:tetratricopeptide repeat protein [Burkholderiaceae bacterium]